ncbi:MAG: hypothetical protein ACLFPD_00345 [Desulfosudaceae bacterium]
MSSRSNNNGSDFRQRLAAWRISSAQTNAAYKIPVDGDFVFLKIYGPKHPRGKYELRKFLDGLGWRQPVEYQAPEKRCRFEQKTLRHWQASGFHVPAPVTPPLKIPPDMIVLATTYIEGPTLRESLSGPDKGGRKTADRLAGLFTEVAARHERALAHQDYHLLHIDANTRNIIFGQSAVFHVDFEMGRPWKPVVAGAAREVLKLLVSVADDAGPGMHPRLFELFRQHYRHDPVYACIADSITGRPLQGWHRLANQRKKQRHPNKITLYELAEYLF